MERNAYLKQWDQLSAIEVTMVRKDGKCPHNVGDTFVYENPYERPQGLCHALVHVLDLYTWRVVLGFPSWEADDETVYRIHCPSKTGTVWEMRKARPE
jgi:uncharacterized repeat protein (TIGR04076 family)